MVPFIYTAREHHGVSTPREYADRHHAAIAAKARRGMRFQVHDDLVPIRARIDANSWIVDCACGAGNAADPAWGVAHCFGCGAVHREVLFPAADERVLIEATLMQRTKPLDRCWAHGETLEALAAENALIRAEIPLVVSDALMARRRANP